MKTREFNIKVEKVGIKYLHVMVVFEKTQKKAKLLIDENTKGLVEGQVLDGKFLLEESYNSRGWKEWTLTLLTEEKEKEREEQRKHNYAYKKYSGRMADFLGYIDQSIEEYWYSKGEAVVLESIAELQKIGYTELAEQGMQDLEGLRAKRKEIEDSLYTERDYDAPYVLGDIYKRKGKYYKVVKAYRSYEPDGRSFGRNKDSEYCYFAVMDCRGVSAKEIEKFELGAEAFAKKEAERKAQYEEEKRQAALAKTPKIKLQELIKKVQELGTIDKEERHLKDLEEGAEVLYKDFDVYGSGRALLVKDGRCWLIINNSGDGDNWDMNTIDGSYYAYSCEKALVDYFLRSYRGAKYRSESLA